MEAYDSIDFRDVVNNADVVIPDGKPLSLAQKLLGHKEAAQVRGEDIMNAICALSKTKLLNIGLYGGSSDKLLSVVKQKLLHTYPDINITYACSPPFRALTVEEDAKVVDDINHANVDILFVGIGCPKQEYWMFEHKGRVNSVMLGVGAAYDFIAGSKRHAPRWVQKIGLEWFFRLCSEPKRLWMRYFFTNPRFIWYLAKQLLNNKLRGRV
jgi:N-acetylglucosaminyldiphosphoundecaprenol N-acetyl-beta-D-mannosaminyltransferase